MPFFYILVDMDTVKILIVVFSIIAGPLGWFFGKLAWNNRRSKVLAAKQSIVEYDLSHRLTPAEFAMLINGVASSDAALGQLAYLLYHHVVTLSRERPGLNLTVIKPVKQLSADESIMLQDAKRLIETYGSGARSAASESVLVAIQNNTLNSLQEKGWISERPARAIISDKKMVIMAFLSGIVISIATILQKNDVFLLQLISVVMYIVAIIGYIVIILYFTALREFFTSYRKRSLITRRISSKYRNEYTKVHGVYTYIKVAGLDTMTPDYADLSSIQGLDKLYPYAVAIGLDTRLESALRGKTPSTS